MKFDILAGNKNFLIKLSWLDIIFITFKYNLNNVVKILQRILCTCNPLQLVILLTFLNLKNKTLTEYDVI